MTDTPEPDPLNEILEAAGVLHRHPDTNVNTLAELTARDEPTHTWVNCIHCARPIRYRNGTWIDNQHAYICDAALIYPDTPTTVIRHEPPDHPDTARAIGHALTARWTRRPTP